MRTFIVWLQVFLQLLMPVVVSGARAASSPFSSDHDQTSPQYVSSTFSPRGLSGEGRGGDATGMATGMASSAAGNAAEQWLRQFGTAQVNLRTDPRFSSLEGSSLDLLVPLYDTPRNIFFTQGGVRYNDDRVTTNLGLGHRHFTGSWMLGYNAFYDSTWNNVNRRWGLGLEAWRDNLRISTNLYQGISGWHASRQHNGYDERPADGWDVRIDGWLPAVPQIGMKAVYEQYYGNNVALFNSFSDRQNNPHALTLGLNYTPIPLITVGVDQRMGKGGVNDTQLTASLNYRIGEPWSKQVSPAAVAALRDISNSRLELVNRNNEIVLDYRKQMALSLAFPTQLTAEEGSVVTFTPSVKSSNGLDHLELDDAALLQAGGQLLAVTNTLITVRMPAYQPQPVRLSGVAVDRKGNRSNVAETLLVTTQTDVVLTLTTDKTQAAANGSDAIVATLHLTDRSGTAVAKQAVTWRTSGGTLSAASTETDSAGNATVNITSTTPGNFTITATAGNKTASTSILHFTAVGGAQISVDKTTVTANGTDAATYTVTMTDGNNQPVSGQTVNWTTNFGTLTAASGTTNASGQVTVKLTSGTAGMATVTAAAAGQTLTAPVVTFVANVLNPVIAVDKTTVTANGTDAATYTVTVTDGNSQPVSGQTVNWTTNFGTLTAASGTTNASGQVTVKLTSGTAGMATVTAAAAGQTLTAPVVTFVAQSAFGDPALDVETASTSNGEVININQSFISQYTTRYSGMAPGDTVTLSFDAVDINGAHFTFTDSHTVTQADVNRGSVIMGPYGDRMQGIQTQGPTSSIRDNATFTSTVNRPSTGQTKSVSVIVWVDTL